MENSENKIIRQVNTFKWIAGIALIVAFGSIIFTMNMYKKSQSLITTKGIIVQDADGNDRILIGTPIPYSKDRARTDSAKAWDTYVKKWPENYQKKVWDWYKDYNHSASGIVILNETGHDRIALASPTPDPTIGKRIVPSTGLIVMDEEGNERAGYGILRFEDKHYRVVLGLDSKSGTEGVALIVDDEGYNGMTVPGKERSIFLGNADTTFWLTDPHEKFNGLIMRSQDSVFFKNNSR